VAEIKLAKLPAMFAKLDAFDSWKNQGDLHSNVDIAERGSIVVRATI